MPQVRYAVATSLDGYISRADGSFDWIISDPTMDFGAAFARFDTFLVGRKTFDLMRQPGSPPLPPGSKTFVFSRTLKADYPGVSVLSEVSAAAMEAIRAQARKDVWLFGGGELFRSLLDLGLVDAVEVKIMPVLLGDGTPLLAHPAREARLRLTGHRVYTSGIVSLEYEVTRAAE
ncbi:MAG TPA: dihydrofolate reductase family protein [Gemmatimonadales bacterium]|nr:dihydrofolate reductase family protein [Gemmatimonadales bacterium]